MIFSAKVAHYKSPLFLLGVFLVFFLDFGALRWSSFIGSGSQKAPAFSSVAREVHLTST